MDKFEFRKIKIIDAGTQDSYPLEEEVEYDTIGLYKNNPDGTQTYLDEMSETEMKNFRQQENYEEVLLTLNKTI